MGASSRPTHRSGAPEMVTVYSAVSRLTPLTCSESSCALHAVVMTSISEVASTKIETCDEASVVVFDFLI